MQLRLNPFLHQCIRPQRGAAIAMQTPDEDFSLLTPIGESLLNPKMPPFMPCVSCSPMVLARSTTFFHRWEPT